LYLFEKFRTSSDQKKVPCLFEYWLLLNHTVKLDETNSFNSSNLFVLNFFNVKRMYMVERIAILISFIYRICCDLISEIIYLLRFSWFQRSRRPITDRRRHTLKNNPRFIIRSSNMAMEVWKDEPRYQFLFFGIEQTCNVIPNIGFCITKCTRSDGNISQSAGTL
jgi:hypothetical protein